ncbi:hypothetical protein L8U58_04470 [Corynebacterium sp. c9Ua_112]|uniref:Secreted protein n=1 Tax=Corynebacterium macclintockiae TaxID=2913501 RepID=A0A9X3RR99_9CORY|nr:hypothetical protein [Corynebacterium macclintockiae]MCZ9304792.1 hypothetical protein [Corynebacterium macclintockiae]
MKLKKSLLALTTAATVAVAGTTAAVAAENTTAGSPATTPGNGTDNGDKTDPDPSKELTDKEKQKKERQEKLAGSANKFFDWNDKTSGLDKMKSVVTLITTIGALVAGIVTLASNFGKIEKLFK